MVNEGTVVAGGSVGPMISGTKVTSSGVVVGGPGFASGAADAGGAEGCQADCLESGAGRVCFEPEPCMQALVQQVAYVGAGAGSWDRAEVTSYTGYRCRAPWSAAAGRSAVDAVSEPVHEHHFDCALALAVWVMGLVGELTSLWDPAIRR
eukprot:Skav234806  [mRNA]  locus=scaffold69:606957:619333:- [translate_table: standard]